MGKSRQRYHLMIIKRKQKFRVTALEGAITAAGWTYILFWSVQLIVSIAAWIFGSSLLLNQLIIFGDFTDFIRIAVLTVFMAACWLAISYLWSLYNFKVFGAMSRRKDPGPATIEDIVRCTNLPATLLMEIQNSKYIRVHRPYCDKGSYSTSCFIR